MRMALHTQHAQQSYCFGNFPRERGLVITWFTPTLFTPLSIGSYWTESIGKKCTACLLSHSGSDFGSSVLANLDWKLSAPTVCIHRQPLCFLPVACPDPQMVLKLQYDYVLGNLSQWQATPRLTLL